MMPIRSFRLSSLRPKGRYAQFSCLFLLTVQVLSSLYLSLYLQAVPLQHLTFVICSVTYAAFTNQFLRRSLGSLPPNVQLQPRSIAPVKQSARLLFPFTVSFSIITPVLLLIFTNGHCSNLYRVLAPHLFLVLVQIFLETIGSLNSKIILLYVRFGLTVAFAAYRLPVILTWYYDAITWAQTDDASNAPPYIGPLAQAAAVVNLVFWSFALLCFLLLYCLPAIIKDPQKIILDSSHKQQTDIDKDKKT